jgi:hypothetical protein
MQRRNILSVLGLVAAVGAGVALSRGPAWGQGQPDRGSDEVRHLTQRIERLKARVAELELVRAAGSPLSADEAQVSSWTWKRLSLRS